MSNIAAFLVRVEEEGLGLLRWPELELVQFLNDPNSAIWQTTAGWGGGPAQFTSDSEQVPPVAGCYLPGGQACVFLTTVNGTVQYMPFARPGTASMGQWQSLSFPEYVSLPASVNAAQLNDGTVQVFVWAIDNNPNSVSPGGPALYSCWQPTAGTPGPAANGFNQMTLFEPQPNSGNWDGNLPPSGVLTPFASASLPDGRLQLWTLVINPAIGGGQLIYTCYKESTTPGAPWSAWATVSSTAPATIAVDSTPVLSSIAACAGPATGVEFYPVYNTIDGTIIVGSDQQVYLFGITGPDSSPDATGGLLVMASFTPDPAAPAPLALSWGPLPQMNGFPSGATAADLTVIGLPNGGIQIFAATVPAGGGTATIYTQSLQAHLVRTQRPVAIPPADELVFWGWSDWEPLPT
jgi:hypothetical protein